MLNTKKLFSIKDLMLVGQMTRGKVDFLRNSNIISQYKKNVLKFTYFDALIIAILKELKSKFPLQKSLGIVNSFVVFSRENNALKDILDRSDYIVFGEVNDTHIFVENVSDIALLQEAIDTIFRIPDITVNFKSDIKYNSYPVKLKNTHIINLKVIKNRLDSFGNECLKDYAEKKEHSLSLL